MRPTRLPLSTTTQADRMLQGRPVGLSRELFHQQNVASYHQIRTSEGDDKGSGGERLGWRVGGFPIRKSVSISTWPISFGISIPPIPRRREFLFY